jgi:hypothetical protein
VGTGLCPVKAGRFGPLVLEIASPNFTARRAAGEPGGAPRNSALRLFRGDDPRALEGLRARVSFRSSHVCYSVKANSTLAILRLMAAKGAGFDVVSGGELQRVLRASRKAASKVVFSGVGKTAAEMELALRSGILLFNIESASELNLLSRDRGRLKKRAAVAVRVNPEVSAKTHPYISTGLHRHKFGVPIPEAGALYAQAAKQPYLKVAGVSVHIGSQITDVGTFRKRSNAWPIWSAGCASRVTTFATSTPAEGWEFPTKDLRQRFENRLRLC